MTKISITQPALHQLLERIDRLQPTGHIGDGMVAQLRELAGRVRQEHLDDLLSQEWSGTAQGQGSGPMGSGGDGREYPACPECGGLMEPNGEFNDSAVGHRPGCKIADALGRKVTVDRGTNWELPV